MVVSFNCLTGQRAVCIIDIQSHSTHLHTEKFKRACVPDQGMYRGLTHFIFLFWQRLLKYYPPWTA